MSKHTVPKPPDPMRNLRRGGTSRVVAAQPKQCPMPRAPAVSTRKPPKEEWDWVDDLFAESEERDRRALKKAAPAASIGLGSSRVRGGARQRRQRSPSSRSRVDEEDDAEGEWEVIEVDSTPKAASSSELSGDVALADIEYGTSSQVGTGREENQDRVHVYQPENDKSVVVFAVYDGHGGSQISNLLAKGDAKNGIQPFAKFLLSRIASDYWKRNDEVMSANVANLFTEYDSRFCLGDNTPHLVGSTATIVVVKDMRYVHMFWVGDSPAALFYLHPAGMMAETMITFPHTPLDDEESKRIEERGGHVIFGRVEGKINISRAFGDKEFKISSLDSSYRDRDLMLSKPSYFHYEMKPNEKFTLLVASDGVIDADKDMFIRLCKSLVEPRSGYANVKIDDTVADSLVVNVLASHSRDDISIVAARLARPSTQ